MAITGLILAWLIGYVDYLTGYERSLLLFYLIPISLAAWFGSFAFGLAVPAFCVIEGELRFDEALENEVTWLHLR